MMNKRLLSLLLLVPSLVMASTTNVTDTNSTLTLDQRLARFTTVELTANLTNFTPGEKLALKKLKEVAELLDEIYIRQAWENNPKLLRALKHKAHHDKNARKQLQLFHLFKGPWDRVDHEVEFIDGVGKKPVAGSFYPANMTKPEFETWVETLSESDQKKAKGFFHVIKRNPANKTLTLSPYSEEYKEFLIPAAKKLKEAAATVDDESLKTFLNQRADSFLSNDYLQSELAWLKISNTSRLEVTTGPYEVYTDGLFGYKSAFEMFVHARDFESSAMLSKFSSSLMAIEKLLPVPENYKNTALTAPPIVVVDELYNGGDVAVPMTAAYNLPNDEEAIQKGGSKLVIIKNVQQGKFKYILEPIAKMVIAEDQMKHISFEAFFNHVLMHEVAHSNGPHFVIGSGNTTVRSKLQDYHSTLEEAKADITGLFAISHLIETKVITDISLESFYTTFLASSFRSIRFGLNEAHGRGQALQLNYLLDKGGFEYNETTQRFSVNYNKIKEAVSELTGVIMKIQGDGDYAKAGELLTKLGINRDYTKAALKKLEVVPVDIQPKFLL